MVVMFRFTHIFKDYFIKAIEHFFRVYRASSLRGLGEFSKVMQTQDVVEGSHNCLKFFQPFLC